MTGSWPRFPKALFHISCALAVLCNLAGCARSATRPGAGLCRGGVCVCRLAALGHSRIIVRAARQSGERGRSLFALDSTPEKAALDEAERRVSQAGANLQDAKKGKRPSEIESLKEQMKQARAALVLSEKEFARREHLFAAKAISAEALDLARSTNDQNRHRVSQLEADITTAQLGSRTDQILAAEAATRAQEAALAKAQWELSQKQPVRASGRSWFLTLSTGRGNGSPQAGPSSLCCPRRI